MRLPLLFTISSLCILPSLASAQAAPRTLGSALPEPLSFAGATSTDNAGMAGLTFRIGSRQEEDNGISIDQNYASVTADVRARFNPSMELFASIPFSSFSQTIDAFGFITETDESTIANPSLGVLFSPAVRGPVRASFGVSAIVPTTDPDNVDQNIGLASVVLDPQNISSYRSGLLSLRPEARLAFDAGALVFQGVFGLDLAVNEDQNVDNDQSIVRLAGSAAFALSPTLALMGELSIVDDLDDQNNDQFTTMHLGTRMTVNTLQGNKLYPAVQVLIPVSDAAESTLDFGFAFDLRASF